MKLSLRPNPIDQPAVTDDALNVGARDAAAAAVALGTVARGAARVRIPAAEMPRSALTIAVLAAADAVALAGAGAGGAFVAVAFGAATGRGPNPGDGLWLVPLLALVPLAFALSGLYPAAGLGPIAELRRLAATTAAVLGAAAAALALAGAPGSAALVAATAVAAVALLPVARAAARTAFAHRPWWGVPAVVLGAGEAAMAAVERLRGDPALGLRPVACWVEAGQGSSSVCGLPLAAPPAGAADVRALGARHAVLPMPPDDPAALHHLAGRTGLAFPVTVALSIAGAGPAGAGPRAVGGAVGVYRTNLLEHRLERAVKVLLDVALLIPALALGLPVIALSALAVMLVSPGNPFYAQEREGVGGRSIRVWKIRTMHLDAAAMLERHLRENPAAREQWERFYKLDHDPRILPVVGHLLRASSLDELPQVINILRGDMSFVGPRPFPRYHLDAFSPEFRALRAQVRPGLTGLWQVSARSDGDLQVQEAADTYYVCHWSLWLDLYLLARTPVAVLLARGAR